MPNVHPKHPLSWHLTVAAVIERDSRFLVVEETDGVHTERVLNQPAGHVEPGESLLDAVRRETWEETGLAFCPESIVGVYQLKAKNGRDYVRVCFVGSVPTSAKAVPQDPDILACHWLDRTEIAQRPRSNLVLRCIDDYLSGRHFPLEAVDNFMADDQDQGDGYRP